MSSYSRQQLEQWLSKIEIDGGKVLDIGGSQLPITKRLKSFHADEYNILDLEDPHECKVKPDWQGDIQHFTVTGWQFDHIFCIEVSEYWYDPMRALNNINYSLKTGGMLYISFHFGYPIHKPRGKDFIRYTHYGAQEMLKRAGFEIVSIRTRKIKDTKKYIDHLNAEEYRYDREDSNDVVLSSGSLIIAKKI